MQMRRNSSSDKMERSKWRNEEMKRGTVTEKTVAVPFLERRQPVEDTSILELYWARDEQAIAETQKSYGKYCYSIAYHILHDREDTEECLNDTWMRAWNAIPPKKPNRLELFLGTITRNLSFDRWKAKNAQKRGNGIMDTTLDELQSAFRRRITQKKPWKRRNWSGASMRSCIHFRNRSAIYSCADTGS